MQIFCIGSFIHWIYFHIWNVIPDSPLQGDSGDWEFGFHPLLLCQAISQYYRLHFLLFWVIQIKGKNSKIPCTMHHSDNKQTNKYKQNNINLYVYIKMKIVFHIPWVGFLFHLFYFPLSCPYPGFCPLKASYPSCSHGCCSYFWWEALTPSLPPQ